jgi:hypothetical protein
MFSSKEDSVRSAVLQRRQQHPHLENTSVEAINRSQSRLRNCRVPAQCGRPSATVSEPCNPYVSPPIFHLHHTVNSPISNMSSITPARPASGRGARNFSTNGRSMSHENRLSIIDEDSDRTYSPPPRVPPRAINRPLGRMFGIQIQRVVHGGPPPPYSVYDDVTGPKGEKFSDVRENKRFQSKKKRGGWKRLTVIAILIAGVIAAIVAGVVVGINNHKKAKYVETLPGCMRND